MEELINASFDSLASACESGEVYGIKKFEPNSGNFDQEFIIGFINLFKEFAKGSSFERRIALRIEDDCQAALHSLDEFCHLMQCHICDMYSDEDSHSPLINNILLSLNNIEDSIEIKPSSDSSLYSGIEDLIIRWSNSGTKTAGHLTRQIIEFIESKNS